MLPHELRTYERCSLVLGVSSSLRRLASSWTVCFPPWDQRDYVLATVILYEPWVPVQSIASPQLTREAVTSADPVPITSKVIVTVPHPPPGTHPPGAGETVSGPSAVNTRELVLPLIVQ